MPVTKHEGGTTITGNAILGLRGFYCMQGLQMLVETGGRMRLTRIATPTNLKAIATEFTGKTYARSAKGTAQAFADMQALVEAKSLDELGETHAVNAEVGGVAADLPACTWCNGAGEVKKYAHASSAAMRPCPYCTTPKR